MQNFQPPNLYLRQTQRFQAIVILSTQSMQMVQAFISQARFACLQYGANGGGHKVSARGVLWAPRNTLINYKVESSLNTRLTFIIGITDDLLL